MKYTLLEIVQDILNDMDSDEVNSIFDTAESEQVAQIIKTSYLEMVSNRNWTHLNKLIKLESLADTSRPTHLKLPENVKELNFINYDIRDAGVDKRNYQPMKYLDPISFLNKTNGRDNTKGNFIVVEDADNSVELLIQTDTAPKWFTSFDEEIVVFDAYDSEISNTLLQARFQAQAFTMPVWVHDDDALPDLPSEAFSSLIEEAKSTAFVVLKQQANEKAEQKAGRQRRWQSQKQWAVADVELYPDYGRRPKGASYQNPYFKKD